jgi:flagellar FliJ protein
MNRGFVLQGLLDIAESEVESAAANLGKLAQQLRQQEQKLALLGQYRSDYQSRLSGAASSGLDGRNFRNFSEFMKQLEQAIHQQQAVVLDARRRLAAGRQHWQEKQKKSKAYGTLAQRAATAAMRIENGREQKMQDDFGSRTSKNKTLAGH